MKQSAKKIEMTDRLLAESARQIVLQRPLAKVLLSRVFGIALRWESDVLRALDDVQEITSAQALQEALSRRNDQALLVRGSCGADLDALTALLESSGYPQTIFLETYGEI